MAVKCILTGQTPSVLDGVTENVQTQLNGKVDKVTGKGLSTNDYTSAEKTKLSGIETGAQKNTITGVKGSAETTYRTGNVNITATNIGLGNVDNTSDAEKPISTATKTALDGKQAKVTGAATTITDSDLTANRALISNSSGKVEVSAVTSTELGYLDGVTSNIQTQLNNKLSSAPVASVNNKTGAVTLAKGDVGLGNVDNTSDVNKPISNATQAALNGKQAKITASGILKSDGSGGVTAAEAGTDYVTPASLPNPSDTAPVMDGTAAAGTLATYARGDHKHPADTSKQAKITASGILKGNGSGGVSAAVKGTDYAGISETVTATLLAASWTGTSAPYSYALTVSGVTATSNQEVLPALNITVEQLETLQSANIQDGGQAANTVTLKAFGDKPTIDLPIRVILRGDS